MSMESDMMFSYPAPFLEFNHVPDYNHAGGFADFGTDFFSGNVLDTVSEDLVAELEDGDLFTSLDSTGISCETPFASENGDQKGKVLSSTDSLSESHNFDMLRSVSHAQSSNLNGFCYPSLNWGQVPQIKEAMPGTLEEGNSAAGLASWRMKTNSLASAGTRMASHKLNTLSLISLGEQKQFAQINKRNFTGQPRTTTCSLGGISELNKKFPSSDASTSPLTSSPPLSPLEQVAVPNQELSISLCRLPMKHEFSGFGGEDAQDLVTGVHISREASSSPRVASPSGNLDFEMNTIKAALLDDGNPQIAQDHFFTSANFEEKPALDFPEAFQRVDTEGDVLSPLPRPVQFSRSCMMQRSFSSHALGQLGNRTHTEHPNEAPLLTQTAPLYSSVKRLGSIPAQAQLQLTDIGQTNTNRPAFNSMRRVYSTGDIQTLNGMPVIQEAGSPLHSDSANPEEGSFKIGRYTLEERKNRICRYRQKRTERNFNKKIKYACRKTLADSRPRVRGRFAKNEDMEEILVKRNGVQNHEDDDDEAYQHTSAMSDYWL